MAKKPTQSVILESYSLDELLDLVKEKAALDAEEKFNSFRDQLSQFTSSIGAAPQPKKTTKKVASKTVAKKKKPAAASKTKKRPRNTVPLRESILSVLGSKPMKIDEIQAAVVETGWKSTSKEPKRVVNLELGKLIKTKSIKRAGRGMYKAK